MIFYLCKFQNNLKHLENLMNSGELYFNSLMNFRLSNDAERGDSYESAINISNTSIKEIKCEHPTLGNKIFTVKPNTKTRITHFDPNPVLSFSLFALTKKLFGINGKYRIDDKMLEFGKYVLIIKEPLLFLDKVKSVLETLNTNYKGRLVNYIDYSKLENIQVDAFTKTNTLQHQSEYRIILPNDDLSLNYKKIHIGSISKYCEIYESKIIVESNWSIKTNQK